ncbi:MAG TPA: peptidylprolyl isomerase [Candidatus Saccharimonadia bacterium]|nr:peptidylprolyl isomerase [Candidatus Saccharimonadia bacterium]
MKKIHSTDITGPIKKLKDALPSISGNDGSKDNEVPQEIPRITNDTVSIHREDVLKSARKYIYPLSHSKSKIVIITSSIVIALVIIFFSYCTLALYKFHTTSQFLYKVTEVIPFPVARINGHFVSYNSYLFEIEHYIHYYHAEQGVNFSSTSGKQQLSNYEQQALNKVVDDSYVADLAAQYHIKVTNSQVNNQINIVQQQNRLGSNQAQLADVLKTYYGWSINDFKRELKLQLLTQDVVSRLDTSTWAQARNVLGQLNKGTSFATLASQYSDDTSTKSNGGQYVGTISKNDPNIPVQVITALFSLKAGQYSGIINTGYSLEIVKNISVQDGQITAAHISLNFKDISTFIAPLQQQGSTKIYIKF